MHIKKKLFKSKTDSNYLFINTSGTCVRVQSTSGECGQFDISEFESNVALVYIIFIEQFLRGIFIEILFFY